MKKTILAGLTLAAVIASMPMTGAAPASPTPDNTDMIVVSKAYDLLGAIASLGLQHDEIIGQGQSQKVVAMPFSFSADTLWALADDITALRKVATTYEETRKSLTVQAEAKNGGPLKPKVEAVLDADGKIIKPEVLSDAQKALIDAIQKVYDSERPVAKLFHIKRGDLCLGGKSNTPDCPKDAANKIAPGIISALSPILDP